MSAKALTLRQPYASLVAVGAKTIETRGWSTTYRGELRIHAGVTVGVEQRRIMQPPIAFNPSPIWNALRGGGYSVKRNDRHPIHDLPLGAVVASCRLADCVPMVDVLTGEGPDDHDAHQRALYLMRGADPELAVVDRFADMNDPTREVDVSDQLPFGDFSPGRYAWLLEDIKPTMSRCPRCWSDRISVVGCPTCEGWGRIEPVPMRGRQGLWTPKPEDWPAWALSPPTGAQER